MKKAAIAKAAELGVEYVQKKLTEKEEAKMRAEIEMLQRKMEALVPKDTPMEPVAEVAPEIQGIMLQEKVKSENLNNVLSVAVPLGIGAFVLMAG